MFYSLYFLVLIIIKNKQQQIIKMKSLKLKKVRNAKFRGVTQQHRHCKSHVTEQGQNIENQATRNKENNNKKRLLQKIAQDNLYEFSQFGQNEFRQNRSQQLERGSNHNNNRASRICPWNFFVEEQQNFRWGDGLMITPSISKGQLKSKNPKMFIKVRAAGSLLNKQNSKTMQLAKSKQNLLFQPFKKNTPQQKQIFLTNEMKGYKTMYMKEDNHNHTCYDPQPQHLHQNHSHDRQALKNISTFMNNKNNGISQNKSRAQSDSTYSNNCNKLKFFTAQQSLQQQIQHPLENKLLFARIMDKTFQIKENSEDASMIPIITFGDDRINSLNASRSSSSYNKKIRWKGLGNKENRIIKLPTSIVLTDENKSPMALQKLKLNQLISNEDLNPKKQNTTNNKGCIFYPANNPFIRTNFQHRIEIRNNIANENNTNMFLK